MLTVTIIPPTITPEEEEIRRLGRAATEAAKTDLATAIELMQEARALVKQTKSHQSIEWWCRIATYHARAGNSAACEAEFKRLHAKVPAMVKRVMRKRDVDAVTAQILSDYSKLYRSMASAYKRLKRPDAAIYAAKAEEYFGLCQEMRTEQRRIAAERPTGQSIEVA